MLSMISPWKFPSFVANEIRKNFAEMLSFSLAPSLQPRTAPRGRAEPAGAAGHLSAHQPGGKNVELWDALIFQ